MDPVSTDPAADALAQEADIEWIRELAISPPPVLHEAVIQSPRPFSNPVPRWRAGKLWAWSVLGRNARASTDDRGDRGYPRRIWFQLYHPREIELEPQAASAIEVRTASIAAGKISDPAER